MLIRAYIMGFAMSKMAKDRKDWKPQMTGLRRIRKREAGLVVKTAGRGNCSGKLIVS